MEVQIRTARCASFVVLSREPLLTLMDGSVQGRASMSMISAEYPIIRLETVLRVVDCVLSLLCTKEILNAALEFLFLARLACADTALDPSAQRLLLIPYFRLTTELGVPLGQAFLENDPLLKEEATDHCKACVSETLLPGPVQESDNFSVAVNSEWILSAARDKGEANNNHVKPDKAFASGKKNQQPEDEDEEDEDDDDDDDEAEGGEEDDEDDGDESEEDGNEEDEEEEDEEDEEEDDEDEEGAPVSAPANRRVQNVEDDADSDGEDEEEGVEDEDDFEDGEDEDGEEDEDDDDDDEDVPEPPKKKSKP